MRAFPLGFEPMVAPRSPTPTAGGSTPSEPAPVPRIQCGHQLLDNCRDIVVEASATWLRHGSVAPAEDHGFKSRRWRHVDVAEWRRHRSTKPESAGSTPAVDAHLAVAQWTRAPPSEGGGRTFESCRRGVMSLPVAVLDARSSNRKDVGLLLRLWGFESSSGSADHVVVVQRRGCEHATLVMRVRFPPATPHQTTRRG